jgi:SPOR domain
VTATETPTPAPPAPAPRRCPRCGNELTPGQDWCLSCGADVGSTIVPPPSWRGPVALVVALLAVAAAALILALVELAGDAEQVTVTQQPAGQTPTPTAAAPTATSTATPVTIPPATDNGGTGSTPEIADWPDGKDAWTVVLESSSTQAAAESRANELAGQGVPVGILDSNGYTSIQQGKFVVFSGQYDTKRAADQALQDVSGQVTGGYVRHIIPKTGATASPSASPSTSPEP